MCQPTDRTPDDRRTNDRAGRGLRDLIDGVRPVTADEARELARRKAAERARRRGR